MRDFSVVMINPKKDPTGFADVGHTELVVLAGDSIEDVKNRDVNNYLNEWAKYAREHGVYIVPGLYIEDDYLCLCLIDDNGRVMGSQRACHLNTRSFPELRRGDNINIIDTPFAKIFLCVDVDTLKPQIIRAAVLMGAEVVVSVQYIAPDRYNESMILAGAWQNAQQNCIYILNAHNLGANIIGPCETSEDLSGFIKRMGADSRDMRAELSASSRDKAYGNFPIFKTLNRNLYNRYFGDHSHAARRKKS